MGQPPRLFWGWCLVFFVPAPLAVDIPARHSRRGLVSSLYRSWGRDEWHSPYVCRGWEGQISVSARFLYSIVRGVRANPIRPTCAEDGRGRSQCPPASLIFYRSQGRGEWHSPYVCQDQEGQIYVSARLLHSSHRSVGANGICPTCTEGATAYGRLRTPPNVARPLGSSSGLAPRLEAAFFTSWRV